MSENALLGIWILVDLAIAIIGGRKVLSIIKDAGTISSYELAKSQLIRTGIVSFVCLLVVAAVVISNLPTAAEIVANVH